jgi:hypothetical protein
MYQDDLTMTTPLRAVTGFSVAIVTSGTRSAAWST